MDARRRTAALCIAFCCDQDGWRSPVNMTNAAVILRGLLNPARSAITRDRKVRVIEEALGALNAQRLSHLRRRGVQMLRAQPERWRAPIRGERPMWRRCPHLEPRPRSKLTPARPWFSCLPRRTEGGRFRPTPEARSVSSAFRSRCAWIEKNVCARAACELGRRDDNRYRSFLPPQILRRPKMDRVFAEPNNWHRSQPYAGNTWPRSAYASQQR